MLESGLVRSLRQHRCFMLFGYRLPDLGRWMGACIAGVGGVSLLIVAGPRQDASSLLLEVEVYSVYWLFSND